MSSGHGSTTDSNEDAQSNLARRWLDLASWRPLEAPPRLKWNTELETFDRAADEVSASVPVVEKSCTPSASQQATISNETRALIEQLFEGKKRRRRKTDPKDEAPSPAKRRSFEKLPAVHEDDEVVDEEEEAFEEAVFAFDSRGRLIHWFDGCAPVFCSPASSPSPPESPAPQEPDYDVAQCSTLADLSSRDQSSSVAPTGSSDSAKEVAHSAKSRHFRIAFENLAHLPNRATRVRLKIAAKGVETLRKRLLTLEQDQSSNQNSVQKAPKFLRRFAPFTLSASSKDETSWSLRLVAGSEERKPALQPVATALQSIAATSQSVAAASQSATAAVSVIQKAPPTLSNSHLSETVAASTTSAFKPVRPRTDVPPQPVAPISIAQAMEIAQQRTAAAVAVALAQRAVEESQHQMQLQQAQQLQQLQQHVQHPHWQLLQAMISAAAAASSVPTPTLDERRELEKVARTVFARDELHGEQTPPHAIRRNGVSIAPTSAVAATSNLQQQQHQQPHQDPSHPRSKPRERPPQKAKSNNGTGKPTAALQEILKVILD